MKHLRSILLVVLLAGASVSAYSFARVSVVAAQASEPLPPFQLRIWDHDGLLVSTWAGEKGALQDAASDGGGGPITLGEDAPSFLEPLARVLRSVPDADRIRVEGLRLGPARSREFTMPPPLSIPLQGVLTPELARSVNATNLPEDGVVAKLGDVVPIRITPTTNGLNYTILLEDGWSAPVPRTEGLRLQGVVIGDRAIFTLVALDGPFRSLGCSPIPGTRVPPGYYVPAELGIGSFAAYENEAEFLLADKLVDIELEIIRK